MKNNKRNGGSIEANGMKWRKTSAEKQRKRHSIGIAAASARNNGGGITAKMAKAKAKEWHGVKA
jgi:hypothetical protein